MCPSLLQIGVPLVICHLANMFVLKSLLQLDPEWFEVPVSVVCLFSRTCLSRSVVVNGATFAQVENESGSCRLRRNRGDMRVVRNGKKERVTAGFTSL